MITAVLILAGTHLALTLKLLFRVFLLDAALERSERANRMLIRGLSMRASTLEKRTHDVERVAAAHEACFEMQQKEIDALTDLGILHAQSLTEARAEIHAELDKLKSPLYSVPVRRDN